MTPDRDGLTRAAQLLRGGGVVAFPTDTVYGLGADAADDLAQRRIYQIKGRQLERIELTRHFGPFDATIAYSVDQNLHDHGLRVRRRPQRGKSIRNRRDRCKPQRRP